MARLIGRQRARIPKRFLLSPAKAALYAAGAAATVLLASVDTFGGALALGWFAGLGYARQNMLVTAPVYVLSVIAFSPSPWTLLFVSVPVVVFAVMYAVCTRLRKRVRPVAGAAAALVTELPHAVLSALSGESVTACVLCAVLAGAFAFVAQTICYAVFFRGIKTRLTDELIAGGIAVVVFCYAAAGVRVQGLSLVFMFVPFFSVLLACGSGAGAASAFAVLAGAGGTLSFGDALFLAYCAVSAGAASALRPFTLGGHRRRIRRHVAGVRRGRVGLAEPDHRSARGGMRRRSARALFGGYLRVREGHRGAERHRQSEQGGDVGAADVREQSFL